MPPAARQRMADILGHVGAWAPAARAGGDGGAARRRARRSTAYLGEMRAARRSSGSTAWRPASRRCARDGLPGRGRSRRRGRSTCRCASRSPGQTQRGDAASCCSTRAGLGAGAVPGVRPARGQRLVPHLGRRRLAGGDRRRAAARARRAGRRLTSPARTRLRDSPRRPASGAPADCARRSCCASALFPFAENKHGDAPMRALIAERMVLEPASAAVPRTYCQFGPLHTTLMRPFIALDPLTRRARRATCRCCAGMAVFFPFLALRAPAGGRARARALAAFALAVSPLHIQASTTAASEALYLLLWVSRARAAAGRAGIADAAAPSRVAGLLASLAAVTRYDAWLALPDRRASRPGWFARRPEPACGARGLAVFALCAASLPVAWLAWGARGRRRSVLLRALHLERPRRPGRDGARRATARWLGRARQLGVWALAFVAAMTPAGRRAGRARRWRAAAASRALLAPPCASSSVAALGAARALPRRRGSLLQSFEPLARFALVPGALLLPLAAAARAARARRAPFRVGDGRRGGRVLHRRVAGRDRRAASASGRAPSRWGR